MKLRKIAAIAAVLTAGMALAAAPAFAAPAHPAAIHVVAGSDTFYHS